MKKYIRIVIITLLLISISCMGITNAGAVANPFNVNCATGAIKDTGTPEIDTDSYGLQSAPGSLPSSIDLSDSESFPCVRSQGSVGSCTAWATTYYQFGYQVAKMNSWNAKNDETKQFSPKWTYNFTNGGNNKGSIYSNAYDILLNQGAVRYSEFTPSGIATESEYRSWYLDKEGMNNALQYRISDYQYLAFASSSAETPIVSPNSASLTVMKSLLNSGHVLTFQTDFGEWDYEKLSSQYDSSLNDQYVCIKQYDANGVWNGHAMAIVGYDDNITYDLNGDGVIQNYEKGAFKIVNSWGTDYGNQGFIWVMYDALNAVSNADSQNVSTRKAIFNNYAYYVITVEEYPLDLIAEVTLNQSVRNQLQIKLGQSDISSVNPSTYTNTMLNFSGGAFNFSGLDTTVMNATFVFDYGTLCSSQSVRKNYYVSVKDSTSGNNTTVKNIKLIDKTGKNVVDDNLNSVVDKNTILYKYSIGMVGDVNNDARISVADSTEIQKYLAGLTSLTDDDLIVSDVNGDGNVNITDVTELQKYIANILSDFDNGHFALLS